jgi:hypothetical protein
MAACDTNPPRPCARARRRATGRPWPGYLPRVTQRVPCTTGARFARADGCATGYRWMMAASVAMVMGARPSQRRNVKLAVPTVPSLSASSCPYNVVTKRDGGPRWLTTSYKPARLSTITAAGNRRVAVQQEQDQWRSDCKLPQPSSPAADSRALWCIHSPVAWRRPYCQALRR